MVIPLMWESPPLLVAAADVVVPCESAPWRAYIPCETMFARVGTDSTLVVVMSQTRAKLMENAKCKM